MEDLRDKILGEIMTKFQCACRHYLAMCEYKRRLDQEWVHEIEEGQFMVKFIPRPSGPPL